MVFNWFRRQFGTSEAQETPAESTPAEPEQQAPPAEKAVEPESAEEQSAVAEDYLSWAKAAYKNIQQQQTPEETEEPEETAAAEETRAPTPPETAEEAETSVPPTETAPPLTAEEAAPPEAPETTEMPVAEVAEAPVEVTPPEAPEAPTAAEPEAPEEAPAPTPEAPETEAPAAETPEAPPIPEAPETEVPAAETPEAPPIPEAPETEVPAAETPEAPPVPEAPETEAPAAETPAAPVPIWARQEERQARLERLKATAVETPAPEPVQPPTPATAPAAAVEKAGGIAFDEEFIWSAEVLAAQGRRPEDVSVEEISWLKRLRQGLGKTRRSLVNQLKSIVGQGPLNQDAVTEIEALLLQADVGIEATDYIIETLQAKLRQEALPPEQAIAYLKKILRDLLDRPCQNGYSTTFVPEKDTLNIWLITGVNGAGKTTTIGKIAHLANKSGYSSLIAAADTFRAAAVEQVKIWGERSSTEVIANPGKNTDPAAVVFDAITAAQSRHTELLLVDTAGRLQNKKNLMEELSKIRRIIDKKASDANVESLLVLDATLGQNGLRQAQVFSEAAKLSGVVLTKLDGTAKGGVALAVVQQLGLPIRFIGAGEGIEDLRPFSSYEFVEALLSG
jgi:fused signal recognition particle receptor